MFAACHVHEGEREAWVDVILGSLRSDDASDHVTFGARVGPVAGQADPAATAEQVGLTSVLAAPLYARGSLLGVLAVARSDLTGRTDRNYAPADRDLISAVAGQVAIAIDNAVTARRRAPDRTGPAAVAPATP